MHAFAQLRDIDVWHSRNLHTRSIQKEGILAYTRYTEYTIRFQLPRFSPWKASLNNSAQLRQENSAHTSDSPVTRQEGGRISASRLESCNSVAPKRANNKIGFGHPRPGAYVARDSKGGFSEGGQGTRLRGGRAGCERSKTPLAISVPSTWHITWKLTRTGTSGAASSELWSFHLWDLLACGSRDKEYDRCR